jgi:hypothetical protein
MSSLLLGLLRWTRASHARRGGRWTWRGGGGPSGRAACRRRWNRRGDLQPPRSVLTLAGIASASLASPLAGDPPEAGAPPTVPVVRGASPSNTPLIMTETRRSRGRTPTITRHLIGQDTAPHSENTHRQLSATRGVHARVVRGAGLRWISALMVSLNHTCCARGGGRY